MARLTLTIPDPLQERLERLRDKVNVPDVCAIALTKELDMAEGITETVSGDKVQRLVERFLQQRVVQELWYRRGRQDGETWAIERASLEELRMLAEEMPEGAAQELDSLSEIDPALYPSVNAKQLLDEWRRIDQAEQDPAAGEADWRAYLQGWQHACCDLWRAAKPSLQ